MEVFRGTDSNQLNLREKVKGSVGQQLATDLELYLKRFKSTLYGIRLLSKECGISPKTIKRLIKQENQPTYQTLTKIYSVIFETDDYQTILKKCGPETRSYLKKYSPRPAIANESKANRLAEMLRQEPLSIELFVRAGIAPLKTRDLGLDYGRMGLDIAARFEAENIFVRGEDNAYSLSPNMPNLDGEVLKILGLFFAHKYAKPRSVMGENSIAFYAEGLNEEGMKKWLEIDSKAFYQKLEIARDSRYQGKIPTFTFCATDSLQKESK